MLAVDRRRVISSALADGRAPRAGADNICDRMNRMRAKSTTAQDDEHHPERVDGGTGREARERRPHRANELDVAPSMTIDATGANPTSYARRQPGARSAGTPFRRRGVETRAVEAAFDAGQPAKPSSTCGRRRCCAPDQSASDDGPRGRQIARPMLLNWRAPPTGGDEEHVTRATSHSTHATSQRAARPTAPGACAPSGRRATHARGQRGAVARQRPLDVHRLPQATEAGQLLVARRRRDRARAQTTDEGDQRQHVEATLRPA